MSVTVWLALLAIAVGGAGIAIQAPINSRMAEFAGGSLAAAAISFGTGFVVLAAITALRGQTPGVAALASAPWWAWTGGALGAFYVWAAIWSVSSIGVVTMVAALIFGQLMAALLLDAFGAFGLQVRAISPTRILAVLFVGAGLVLSRV